MEAVREDENDITVAHIIVLELVRLCLVTAATAALVGEVVCFLLRGCPEIHLECVVRTHMEKCVT